MFQFNESENSSHLHPTKVEFHCVIILKLKSQMRTYLQIYVYLIYFHAHYRCHYSQNCQKFLTIKWPRPAWKWWTHCYKQWWGDNLQLCGFPLVTAARWSPAPAMHSRAGNKPSRNLKFHNHREGWLAGWKWVTMQRSWLCVDIYWCCCLHRTKILQFYRGKYVCVEFGAVRRSAQTSNNFNVFHFSHSYRFCVYYHICVSRGGCCGDPGGDIGGAEGRVH